MNALPDSILDARSPVTGELEHTGDMLKVIAAHYVGPIVRDGQPRSSSRRCCSRP